VRLILAGAQLPVAFLVNAWVRGAMLPTSFGRACLVVQFECLVAFVICTAMVSLVLVLAALAR
jgi:hypothetical protein